MRELAGRMSRHRREIGSRPVSQQPRAAPAMFCSATQSPNTFRVVTWRSIEPKFDTVHARLLVMFLAFVQPLVRGWSRYFTWLHFKRTPGSVIRAHEHLPESVERL